MRHRCSELARWRMNVCVWTCNSLSILDLFPNRTSDRCTIQSSRLDRILWSHRWWKVVSSQKFVNIIISALQWRNCVGKFVSLTYWTTTFRVSVSKSCGNGFFIGEQSMQKAANESHAELCGFSKDPVWLAQIMQNISIFYLRYTRCTHIAPSRRILTLSTRYTYVAYVAHVHSSYTRCTHVMLRTLHLRSVAQAHLCCTGAFSLRRFSHDAQVHSCCSGATMLHKVHSRCTHFASVCWCYTCTLTLHICTHG